MTKTDKYFYIGFAVAVATLARNHDEPTLARNIMESCGVTLAKLKAASVEEYDLKAIRKAVRR